MSEKNILGRWDSVAIGVGIVIGVGIFRVPAEVCHHLQSGPLILLTWFLGGVISLLGALCYAELAARYPHSGGDYTYLKEAYGKVTAFLFAWSELLITRTGSVAAIALMFGEYSSSLMSIGEGYTKPLAIGIVIVFALTNLLGLKESSRLQNFLTVTKVLTFVITLIAGFCLLGSPAAHRTDWSLSSVGPIDLHLLSVMGIALVPILWTYGGWRDNIFLAGETKQAERSIPFALLATCLVVTVIYCGMNFLYLSYIPIEKLTSSKLVADELFRVLFGPIGATLVKVFIAVYGLGAINALLLTGSRIGHAMAEDNKFFVALSKTNEKTDVPVRSLAFNAVWSCLLILTGTFEQLLFFTGLAVWIFFSMVALAVIIVRRKEKNASGFLVPFYPMTPIVVAVISGGLALSTIIYYPTESLIGTGIVLSGMFVYFAQGLIKIERA